MTLAEINDTLEPLERMESYMCTQLCYEIDPTWN